MALKIKGEWFIDAEGRTVLLRGINVGGNCKYPAKPNGATHIKTDFLDHKDVSYIGHPFPLAEADEHFARFKRLGFNCMRWLTSWEAIEHSGPKQYDKEYLAYIEEILKIATKYKLYFFMDPHQDVWSRMSGGDGAPGWTFEKVGLDFTKFDASEAAYVMQYRYRKDDPNSFPPLYWNANNIRYASCTMWTLFWASKDFAPSLTIEGQPAQEYLQQFYCEAIKQVAVRIKDNPYLLGFSSINEPPQGWIQFLLDGSNNKGLKDTMGYAFTPIQAMAVSSGVPCPVGFRELKRFGIKETRKDVLNPNKISCWLPGHEDVWRKEGIWKVDDAGNPVILKNDYFVKRNGKDVDFYRDYISPFNVKFAQMIRAIIPSSWALFENSFESLLKGDPINYEFPANMQNLVSSQHWIDGPSFGMKRPMLKASFDMMTDRPVLGEGNIAEMFVRQLKCIKDFGKKFQGGIPTIISEFALAFDMENKEAYSKFKTEGEKAWENHIKCLNLYYDAIDANLLNALQWNYTPTNTNEFGDGWNQEDLSIFSLDQRTNNSDPLSGFRAVQGYCRPYFVSCPGKPNRMEFNFEKGIFNFELEVDPSIKAPLVIFVPQIQYPKGFDIKLSEGSYEADASEQIVKITFKTSGFHSITITRK